MRDILISLFVIGSLPACYRRPLLGLMLFSALAYGRLQDLAWGFARFERWSFYVAIVTFAGWMAAPNRKTPIIEPRTWMMFGLVVMVGLGHIFATGPLPVSFEGYIEYCKIIGIAIFTTSVVQTRTHLRMVVWVIAMSFAFYGVKNGIAGVVSGGNMRISRGPGGMLEDNNDFALAMAMSIPLLAHLVTSEKREILRRTVFWMIPLTVITVALTHSRGAALSMTCGFLVLIWRSRNRIAGFTVAVCLGMAGLALAPQSYKDRLNTIRTYEEDGSARGRLEAWKVAGRMIQGNPIFGVGFDRFKMNYLSYEPNPDQLQLEGAGAGTRVAHNSYLQIWAECGSPAFFLYIGLIVITLIDLWRIRKQARKRYHASWILSYATMFEASTLTFLVGSMFLNRAHFDLMYHYVALVLVFGRIARAEMADMGRYPEQQGARSGALERRQPRGFDRSGGAPRRGFRNTPLAGGRSV